MTADPGRSTCPVCSRDIDGDHRTATRDGKQFSLHVACWEKARAESRARLIESVLLSADAPAWGWARVGTPEFMARASTTRLQNAAKNYSLARGNLSIIGPAATGKTTTLRAIAYRLVDEILSGEENAKARQRLVAGEAPRSGLQWIDVPMLAAARREHRLGAGPDRLSDLARSKPVVILDDLGQELADPRWLLEILTLRFKRGLITLSSSGLTVDQLTERYGSGATRRLVEPTGAWLDLFASSGVRGAGDRERI